MKQIITVILFSFFLTAFTVKAFSSSESIQMVASLSELNSHDLKNDIVKDIQSLSGVQFVDISLMSKTLILNYDSNKISYETIKNILNKWGCSASELTYRTLQTAN